MKLPVPPKDLWEQLDAIRVASKPPKNSFSTSDYAERFGITTGEADRELRRMVRDKRVRTAGKFGIRAYYELL